MNTKRVLTDRNTVDIKRLWPQATSKPWCVLTVEPDLTGSHMKIEVTLWEGTDDANCEGRWSERFVQKSKVMFEIPGIPYRFAIVNGALYYRRNVETGLEWRMLKTSERAQ